MKAHERLKNDIHQVNFAFIKIFQTADTWHLIAEAAKAALNVHMHYSLMNKDIRRSMQDQCIGAGSARSTDDSPRLQETAQEVP